VDNYEEFLDEIGITQEQVEAALASQPLPVPKEIDALYYVAPSKIHGNGTFAAMDILMGDTIGAVMSGDLWTEAGRYTNHSSSPNTTTVILDGELCLIALEPIKKDEELTVDYVQVREIKLLKEKISVIDDFSDSVDVVVASAHAAGFAPWSPNKGSLGKTAYQGMGFCGEHAFLVRDLIYAVGDVVVPNYMFFRLTNAETEKASIHSDRESGSWTCVVYLSDHDQPSGTVFYRHVATGLTEMPSLEELEYMPEKDQLLADIESADSAKWEVVGYTEGKFNRALVFHAPLFHSRTLVKEENRLVWVSHFHKISGNGKFF